MYTDSPSADGSPSLRQRVSEVLESLRPMIQADGGDIELVDVNDQGVVQVRFLGACIGCGAANITLTQGVARNLKKQLPEVTSVILV